MKTDRIKTYAATIQRTIYEYARCEVRAKSKAEAERLLAELCDSDYLEWEATEPMKYRTTFLQEK